MKNALKKSFIYKIKIPSAFWVLDNSESKGSPLWLERKDNPWESCWHIVLMVSGFSVRGDDSGIGVTTGGKKYLYTLLNLIESYESKIVKYIIFYKTTVVNIFVMRRILL